MNLVEAFTWKGKIGRGTYAIAGFLGLSIKHNLDRIIAFEFGQRWTVLSYLYPIEQIGAGKSLTTHDKWFLATLFLTAIPFIWLGITMTVRRLRDVGQPTWLVVLIFAPFVNLVFFLLLCVLPERGEAPIRRAHQLSAFWPTNRWGSAALGAGLGAILGVVMTWIAIRWSGLYGMVLFIAVPFVMGYLASWVHCRTAYRTEGDVLIVSSLTILLAGVGIAAIAIEGAICLIMAAPIAWLFAATGGSLARSVHNLRNYGYEEGSALGAVILALPLLLGAEHASPPPVPRFQVHTSIEIAAPPDLVWKRIIAFPPLRKPTELVFRYAGIAYPIEARIKGEGLTADRECRFSTGSFKEPILAWEPGKHFAFGVADEPLLMTETSPYGQIHVRHLDDHDFQPERADFVLTPLPNGGTRLEGTTIYQNKMWPGIYWRLYTDAIVHSIHRRVFEHVKHLAEADAAAQAVAVRN